MSKLIQ